MLRAQALSQLLIPVSAAASRAEENGVKQDGDSTAGNTAGSTAGSGGDAHGSNTNDSNSRSASLIDAPIGNGSSAEAAASGEESRPDARLAKALAALRSRLADSANEASAFATLQQSSGDADRLKRSVSQVSATLERCRPPWSAVGHLACPLLLDSCTCPDAMCAQCGLRHCAVEIYPACLLHIEGCISEVAS